MENSQVDPTQPISRSTRLDGNHIPEKHCVDPNAEQIRANRATMSQPEDDAQQYHWSNVCI